MRAVAQRVSRARIEVGAEIVGEMGNGLLALVGVAKGDGPEDAALLARKLCGLRVFEDAEGRMNQSLLEAGRALGIVSQFTLMGDVRRGRRPSWSAAANPEQAQALIDALAEAARGEGAPVITGRFQAMMDVHLVNRGPVTILLDSKRVF